MKIEPIIPENVEEVKTQLAKVKTALEMRDKQLDALAKEVTMATEGLQKNKEEKKLLEDKYHELLQKWESLENQLNKERNEKSLIFAQMQVLEAEYHKVKGSSKEAPKGQQQKEKDVLSKIMISVKMQQQDEPKKEKDVIMSDFSGSTTKK